MSGDDRPTPAARLARSLRALGEGDVTAWTPLPGDVSVQDAVAAVDGLERSPGARTLLGQPATVLRAPGGPATPSGIVVWAQHDRVTLVEVRDPALAADPVDALGEPELTMPSGLGSLMEQLLWPSRGLVVHRSIAFPDVTVLFGHGRATVEQLRGSPLVGISSHRLPSEPAE
ncbi:hypothetical protein ACWFNE_10750 [Cellulomonas sp. NPDC055163]